MLDVVEKYLKKKYWDYAMMLLDIGLMMKNNPTKSKFRFLYKGLLYKEPEAEICGRSFRNLKKHCPWMFQLKQNESVFPEMLSK